MLKSKDFSKKEKILKEIKNDGVLLKEEIQEAKNEIEKFKENENFRFLYKLFYKKIKEKSFKKEEKKKIVYRVRKNSQQIFLNKFNFLLKGTNSEFFEIFRLKL